jgi:hypothetical protein
MCKVNHLGICAAVRNYSLTEHGCEPDIRTIDGKRVASFLEKLPNTIIENLRQAGATITAYSRHKHGVGLIHETVISI